MIILLKKSITIKTMKMAKNVGYVGRIFNYRKISKFIDIKNLG